MLKKIKFNSFRSSNQKAEYKCGSYFTKNKSGVAVSGSDPFPAAIVRKKILDEAGTTDIKRDFRLFDCLIGDTLHLEHMQFRGYLRFENCCFLGRIDLRHARFRRLKFVNCVFEKIVEADVAEVDGDVEFRSCVLKQGLAFRAARVSGRFVIEDTDIKQITNQDQNNNTFHTAFDAAMLHAGRGLFFMSSGTSKTILNGGIDLSSAYIGGNLEFRSTDVRPCHKQHSIDLTNSTVRGFFFIRNKTNLHGKLNIFAASLQLFSIDDSCICCCDGYGIDAEEATIATSFTLGDGATVKGINLNSARIGGVFQFGGRADESGDTRNPTDNRLDLSISGSLNLIHARIGRLSIDFDAWHKKQIKPMFNGCIYDDIVSINGRDSVDHDTLQKWVNTIDNSGNTGEEIPMKRIFFLKEAKHHPQNYHQLIGVLRSKGREEDARKIEQRNDSLTISARYSNKSRLRYIPGFLYKVALWLTGYGYSVSPLILIAFSYVLTMSFVYMYSYDAALFSPAQPVVYTWMNEHESPRTPPKSSEVPMYTRPFVFQSYKDTRLPDQYTAFHPFLYSLDVFLPIVSFSQENHWTPVTQQDEVSWLWCLVVIQAVFGWIFSGLLIAGVSGIMRRKL
jgi:hypothetical protein